MIASTDPSVRFVLPGGAPYLENLRALWSADAELARTIESLPDAAGYRVEASKSGFPTLAVAGENQRVRYLHSRYDPVGEAQTLVESITTDGIGVFFVHGLGLGYHLSELFRHGGGDSIICVFEPDLQVIRTAMFQRDLSEIIRSRRLFLVHRQSKSELMTRLMPHMPLLTMGFERLRHAPSIQWCPDVHAQFEQWVDEIASFARTSVNTLVLNGRRTAENVAANIGLYVATPCLSRLKNCTAGSPAIVVSAGPSLRKNMHQLRRAVGSSVIIAVQTTLQPLLDVGIVPQFVTSLDYHDISTRFYERLPKSLATELVAEPKAAGSIFDMYPGPVSLLGNEFAESLLRELKLDRARLPSGATVAHLAFYLAEYLGCDPIIFVGQDLGFSDGLCYAPGTSYDDVWRPEFSRFCTAEMKQWEQIARDRPILRRIPDFAGRAMYTEERLFTYLQQFERDFAKSKARIIDATEGGALKRGATVMSLADAITQHCSTHHAIAIPEHPGNRNERLAAAVDCLRKRLDDAAEIEQIGDQTLPLLEEIRDHLDDQQRVNRAIGRVDALRSSMLRLDSTYNLVTQLTQKSELQRFRSDRAVSAPGLDATERQRRQVSRDIENVRAVMSATREFGAMVLEVMAQLERPLDSGSQRKAA